MTERIYLDNNATTGLDPRVAEVMLDNLTNIPANPSSIHFFGQEAKNKLVKARQTIANFLQVKPSEILFTSGGTESMNMLIRGLVDARSKPHIISSNVEHACIDETLQDLISAGCDVSLLPAGLMGAVQVEDIKQAIRPHTKLLVFGAVNSETGVKHDIEAIGRLAEEYDIPFVVDGVALLGKELFQIPEGVTGIGFSAHKFHGPKGAGFVYLRSRGKLHPLLTGGGQEYGLRSGTENLPGIIGLAEAVDLLRKELPAATVKMRTLRDYFESCLLSRFNFVQINGKGPRVVNTSNLAFSGVDGETLLIQLDLKGIAASHGSACSSGALEPSRVLRSMGLSHSLAKSSVRFSLSRWTTKEEIDQTLEILILLLPKLHKM
jgi:cysteine desulfurase